MLVMERDKTVPIKEGTRVPLMEELLIPFPIVPEFGRIDEPKGSLFWSIFEIMPQDIYYVPFSFFHFEESVLKILLLYSP